MDPLPLALCVGSWAESMDSPQWEDSPEAWIPSGWTMSGVQETSVRWSTVHTMAGECTPARVTGGTAAYTASTTVSNCSALSLFFFR